MKFRRLWGVKSFYLMLYGVLVTLYFGCSSGVPDDENMENSAQTNSESQNDQADNKGDGQEAGDDEKDKGEAGDEKTSQEASANEAKIANSHENVAPPVEEKAPNHAEEKSNVASSVATKTPELPAATDSNKALQSEKSAGMMISGIAGEAAAPGLPELGSKMSYIVKRGDTLSKIANKVYGNSGKWKELAEHSNIKNPNKIFPGEIIYYQLSQESLAFAKEYENLSQEVVQVKTGDTLAKIALKVYGSEYLWSYVWRQIKTDNPDKLEIGSKLYLKSKKSLENLELMRNKGKVLGSKSLGKVNGKIPV